MQRAAERETPAPQCTSTAAGKPDTEVAQSSHAENQHCAQTKAPHCSRHSTEMSEWQTHASQLQYFRYKQSYKQMMANMSWYVNAVVSPFLPAIAVSMNS